MGKLIRNGIEYGGGNGTDIFEVTQAEYDALKQAGTLVHNALYVISDAPNLNATASDIEYSSGVTVKQKIDSKQPLIKHLQKKGTTDSTGDLLVSELPLANYQILSAYKNRNISGESTVAYCVLGANNNTAPYIHCINSSNQNLVSTNVTIEIYYIEI